jgi:hypothetical protein
MRAHQRGGSCCAWKCVVPCMCERCLRLRCRCRARRNPPTQRTDPARRQPGLPVQDAPQHRQGGLRQRRAGAQGPLAALPHRCARGWRALVGRRRARGAAARGALLRLCVCTVCVRVCSSLFAAPDTQAHRPPRTHARTHTRAHAHTHNTHNRQRAGCAQVALPVARRGAGAAHHQCVALRIGCARACWRTRTCGRSSRACCSTVCVCVCVCLCM